MASLPRWCESYGHGVANSRESLLRMGLVRLEEGRDCEKAYLVVSTEEIGEEVKDKEDFARMFSFGEGRLRCP